MRHLAGWIIGASATICLVQAQDTATRLDQILRAHQEHRRLMGSALVAKGGKVILEKGYGMANLELDAPNTPDTKFRLGSITKQFTSTAILQLQEAGKLSVTDAACRYVDNCPETWKAITIHQMLTHTSGIPTYTNAEFMRAPAHVRSPLSPMEIVMLSKSKPLDFEPGSRFLYDNTGYVFLGAIIEKVSGEKYAEYLRKHIFDPLDMKDTGYDDTETLLKNRASGYKATPKGLANADYLDMSLPHAAGSLYSTVRDLYRWDRALYTEKVLKKASLAKAWMVEKNDYGYGWGLGTMADHRHIGHGGGIFGFGTYIARFPDDDALVVVLCNSEASNSQAVARQLAMALFGQKVEAPGERPSIRVESGVLNRYTGEYEGGPLKLMVTVENGRLMMGPAGSQRPAFAATERDFFTLDNDATFTFVPDESGRAKEIVRKIGATSVTLRRK